MLEEEIDEHPHPGRHVLAVREQNEYLSTRPLGCSNPIFRENDLQLPRAEIRQDDRYRGRYDTGAGHARDQTDIELRCYRDRSDRVVHETLFLSQSPWRAAGRQMPGSPSERQSNTDAVVSGQILRPAGTSPAPDVLRARNERDRIIT